ncbi:MAG TPA: zf-HC2 domain-containing protein [Candidatus Baltobacteraceae bacterium]|nr:zf-HC2 domain-containing protein [Candidatus Baltobacteraceae bacterium]
MVKRAINTAKSRRVVIEISCAEVWREISNYIDADVPPELRARMELHFSKCSHCHAVLDGTRNTVHLLADGDWYRLPAGFSERLFERLSATGRKRKT